MRFSSILLIFTIFSLNLQGQSAVDNSRVFPLDSFVNWVRAYHPVMQQVGLLDANTAAEQMKARGGFDPKAFGDYEHKSFTDKNYFRIGEAGLKVPTWFGADVKLAYTWADGIFLNPENNLPVAGQAVAGVEMPLLQGLMFDARRAQVLQASLVRDANIAEARQITNDLLLSAIETYWEWAYAYQVVQVFENSLDLAEARFEIARQNFFQGDKPAIDTLETLIQVENREILLNEALVDFENARLDLSNFLWYEDLVPLELDKSRLPQEVRPIVFQNLMDSDWLINHPSLQAIDVKRQSLEIKERLKRENLKPQLNVEFNFLSDGADFTPESDGFNAFLNENYKWGVNFSYPLFTRKERAGLELVRLEQLDNGFKFNQKRLELQNKAAAILQQLEQTQVQLSTQRTINTRYEQLLEAENIKFRIGESSIFLVNNREQKLIDAQLKLQKLEVEVQKLLRKLDWAMGRLL